MKATINFTVKKFITFGINFSLPLDCTSFCYGLCIIIACYGYTAFGISLHIHLMKMSKTMAGYISDATWEYTYMKYSFSMAFDFLN